MQGHDVRAALKDVQELRITRATTEDAAAHPRPVIGAWGRRAYRRYPLIALAGTRVSDPKRPTRATIPPESCCYSMATRGRMMV